MSRRAIALVQAEDGRKGEEIKWRLICPGPAEYMRSGPGTCPVGKISKQKLHRGKSTFRGRREMSDIYNW